MLRKANRKVREVHKWNRFSPPSSTPLSKALALLADHFTRQTVYEWLAAELEQHDTKVVKKIRGETHLKNLYNII